MLIVNCTLLIVNRIARVFISGFPGTYRDGGDGYYRYYQDSDDINPDRHLGAIDKLLHPSVDDVITYRYRYRGTYRYDVKIFFVEHL